MDYSFYKWDKYMRALDKKFLPIDKKMIILGALTSTYYDYNDILTQFIFASTTKY